MELPLLAASLRSRQDFELIKSYVNVRAATYSKPFQIIMKKVEEYYKRDSSVGAVDHNILLAQVAESIRNPKHVQKFTDLVAEALGTVSSDVNVRAAVLMAKQQEVGDKLAQALAMDSTAARVDVLLEELKHLRSLTTLDELEDDGVIAYANIDLADLIAREFDPSHIIRVYPSSLSDRLDGGAKKGHHLLVFAPVEAGKTAFCINASCGFLRQNLRVLYLINEDRPQDIIVRHISNLSGMTKAQIRDNPARAQELANKNGFGNLVVVEISPGTPAQIEDAVDKYQPDVIILDQLRNMKMPAENRTNQLDAAARAVRDITKHCNVLGFSVTQAADSASGKLVLDTGDVDSSNVGIPAQADVMIGIGVDATLEAEGLRQLSLPKNKISGRHENWPVRIQPQLSRYQTV